MSVTVGEVEEVRGSNAGRDDCFFCKNTENALKTNNSPRLTAFTAKRCKKYAVKIIFVHRNSPHFLRKFTAKPRPG